jgi:ubiquinone/menaquinone biosynthesis C-methylase UbiE
VKLHEYQRNFDLETDYWYFKVVREMAEVLITDALAGQPWGSTIDVGCGTGAWLDSIKTHTDDFLGVDFSEAALEFCKSRGHTELLEADATQVPRESGTFDILTALGLIEHIPDDQAFLVESARLLKPGGLMVLMTSSFPFLWTLSDVANEHQRRYYLRALNKKIQASGFETLRFSHLNFFLFPALASALMAHRLFVGLKADKPERILPQPPRAINAALTAILRVERELIRHVRLPWGVSMIGVFRKTQGLVDDK